MAEVADQRRRAQRWQFHGDLEHVSLVNPGPYIALSYCWGDRTNSQRLKIGAYASFLEVNITDNLASALRALWNKKKIGVVHLRIWIDAICINQNDLYERSQQVQVMRQIYSKATSVVAWVDTANYDTFLENRGHLSEILTGLLPTQGRSQKMCLLEGFFNEMYWKVSNRQIPSGYTNVRCILTPFLRGYG
jgi:hypothetical protein